MCFSASYSEYMSSALLQEGWKFLWRPRILVVAGVEFLQELGAPLVLFQVLHQPLVANHVLPDDVVALLRVLGDVVQLLHPVEEKHINDLFVRTQVSTNQQRCTLRLREIEMLFWHCGAITVI